MYGENSSEANGNVMDEEVPDAVDQRRFFIHYMHTVALASLEFSP